MADGWIELFDVETDEVELLLVFDRFEPVDYGCGVFPLVEVVFFRDCAVDAVEDDKDAFITLKDHKPNFANKPTGKISKQKQNPPAQ